MYFDLSYKEWYQYYLQNTSFQQPLFCYEPIRYKSFQDVSLDIPINQYEPSMSLLSYVVNLMGTTFRLLNQGQKVLDLHKYSASQIISICKTKRVSCNCFSTAIVLCAALAKSGFVSRIVRCMPLDIHYCDCHVITEVYDESLKKWLFLDCANLAAFTDEKGNLLSMLEIRNALINNDHLILATRDAWPQGVEFQYAYNKYYIYLKKNMIRFCTYVESEPYTILELIPERCYCPKENPKWLSIQVGDSLEPHNVRFTFDSTQFWSSPVGI